MSTLYGLLHRNAIHAATEPEELSMTTTARSAPRNAFEGRFMLLGEPGYEQARLDAI